MKSEVWRFMKEKVKEPRSRLDIDTTNSKPINISQDTPEAQLPNCRDCGKPLTMADIGASRDRHLFCPK